MRRNYNGIQNIKGSTPRRNLGSFCRIFFTRYIVFMVAAFCFVGVLGIQSLFSQPMDGQWGKIDSTHKNKSVKKTPLVSPLKTAEAKEPILVNINKQQTLFQLMALIPKRNIGPAAMSGRITSLAMPRYGALGAINRNIIYAGTASGGVWKSLNGGIAWSPIFDDMDVQSIGSVAVDPTNASIVWVGTGEGNPRNSHNSGKGIYRSIDAGKTWKCMGLEGTKTLHRIIINPHNNQQIWAAAMGSIWGSSNERGVYQSNNGGETWTKMLFVNSTTGCAELVIDPENPQKLYAAMYDYMRKPWTYRSGGPGSGLYITMDAGVSWKRVTEKDGFPKGELGRIGLAVSASQPNRVYAIVEAKESAIYTSNDGGANWAKTSSEANAGNRPFYYSELYVHPRNENRVYSIWSQISRSEDAGKHWDILADWGHIHPDHHAFFIHPDDPNYIVNGNDGGLNISYDGGETWRYAENIPVGQFYHVDIDNQEPYNVYGGLQDNGTWMGPAYHWVYGGIRNSEWQELMFGDGFDVSAIPGTKDEGYAMSQGGELHKFNLREHSNQFIKPQHPDGKPLRFNWNAALAIDPENPNGLFYGSQYVHYSPDQGKTWKIISPDLSTNDTAKQHQAKSGGLTIDATGAENHCTILAIAPSPGDKNIIWVGTDDGNVQLTKDGGKNWENVALNMPGKPQNAWVPYLWVRPSSKGISHSGECWVVLNNYRQNDWSSYVYKTLDYGKSWRRMVSDESSPLTVAAKNSKSNSTPKPIKEGGENVKGYVLSVLPDTESPNLVFLGTDHGLWVSINGGETWNKWKKFPSVPVADMKIQSRERDLVLGTFGRGIWVFDDISTLRNLAAGTIPKKELQILNAGKGVLVHFTQPVGSRFSADESWVAPNKAFGVQIDLYVIGKKDDTSQDWKKIDCTGRVFNEANQLIRTHKFSFDSTGFYRIAWPMVEDGFLWPSHNTPKIDEGIPAGKSVIPGKYKVLIGTIAGKSDSAWVEVVAPGNLPFNALGYARKKQLMDTLKMSIQRARLAFEDLKNAEKEIDQVFAAKYQDDSAIAHLRKFQQSLKDSISNLKLCYMLPSDYRPYEEATIRLMDRLQTAYLLIEGNDMPAENCEFALKTAQRETLSVLQKVNYFFENQFQLFLDAVGEENIAPLGRKYIQY